MTPPPTASTPSTPFNVVDQLVYHLDQDAAPWSVQCEVRVDGHLDPARVRSAARRSTERHPLARATMGPPSLRARRCHWRISREAVDVPVTVVDCVTDGDLGRARSVALGTAIALSDGPPWAVTLAHHPAGDTLILNLHHAAGDGMSAYRLMTSIARAYSQTDDRTPSIDPLAVRDLRPHAGSKSLNDVRTRLTGLRRLVRDFRTQGAPARIAVDGGRHDQTGYDFHLIRLDRDQTAQVLGHQQPHATVNDLILASLAMAIRRFNDAHGKRPRRITAMMPVNLRPADWQHDVVSNIVSFVPVDLGDGGDADLGVAQRRTAEATARLKDEGRAGTMIDVLTMQPPLPVLATHRLHRHLNPVITRRLDTTVVSNLGAIAEPLDFADAGSATEVWFSPPARMPLGVAVGVVGMSEQLFLTIRYCVEQFDAVGAAAFADTWRSVLLSGPDASSDTAAASLR